MYSKLENVQAFLANKKILKDRYEAERSGDQQLYRDQSKLYQPIITSQQETAKEIKDKIQASSQASSQALEPLAREFQRRNQVEMLQQQPLPQLDMQSVEPIAESTPEKPTIVIDLDAGLNTTDIENLEDLGFEKPSEVFRQDNYEEMYEKIETENRSIGQFLGKGVAGQKTSKEEKIIHESRKATLKKYKDILESSKHGKKLIVTKSKNGKGLVKSSAKTNVILYNNPEELCAKLLLLDAARQAGNTAVSNDINAILDELLKMGYIDKTTFNILYKKIFI